jgi:molecular chaperone GrpE
MMHDERPTEPSEPSAESTDQPDTVSPDQVPTPTEAAGPSAEGEHGQGDVSDEPTGPTEPSAEPAGKNATAGVTALPETVTSDNEPESPLASEPSAADEAGPCELPNELEQTRQERDEHYKKLLETAAEFDNFRKDVRKREERKRREHDYQVTKDLMNEIVDVIDDLERALAAPEGSGYRLGVELIHKQLLNLIDKHEVTAIEAIGSDFDPNRHEAVQHEPSDAHRDGEVIEEFRRGYMLRDKLLRASMVKVAKA